MSYAITALQEHAQAAADVFCQRSAKPPARMRVRTVRHSRPCVPTQHPRPRIGKFYRPRNHEASPFFKIVRDRYRLRLARLSTTGSLNRTAYDKSRLIF
jgi:hypothetical protein